MEKKRTNKVTAIAISVILIVGIVLIVTFFMIQRNKYQEPVKTDGKTGTTTKTEASVTGTTGKPVTPIYYSKGLKYSLNSDGKSYSVKGIGICKDKDIVIPDRYNGLPVTGIGSSAFRECMSLTSIVIPDSVTSIGDRAFFGCSSLTSVVIGNSVTSIGDGAFYYCSSLTSVVIGNSVTSIGSSAFFGCSKNLESITVSSGNGKYHSAGNCLIDTANKKLISGCKNSIIPTDGSVTSIGYGAFSGCNRLTSIEIPDSVTSIGDGAFYYCSSLTSIVIPDSVTSIGYGAFHGCSSLTSVVIPDSVTSIGDRAFYGCNSLTSVVIPDSVTSIGDRAFFGCSSLTSVVIGNSVTSIGDGAFYYCSSLTSVVIGNSVTSIGSSAFFGCSKNLESITVSSGNGKYHSAGNCLIDTANKTLVLGCKNSIIPTDGSVTSIGDGAFDGCSSLTSIEIPDSVTSIGGWAFYECSSLTSIRYNGTKAQWQNISKGAYWNSNTSNYTVHCTDGDI